MTAGVVLSARDISVHYGGVKALDGFSLDIERGSTWGLVGPNGSGKTTFLAAVSRSVDVTGGSLVLDDRSYEHKPRWYPARAGIARTFQTIRLVPDLTVRENVLLGAGARLFGKPDRHARRLRERRASELLEQCGIARLAGRLPSELPYGSQRMVEIARAFLHEPKVLLLDEPAAGMNDDEAGFLRRLLIEELAPSGVAVLIVDHNWQLISSMCERVVVLDAGRLLAEGTPDEVRRDPVVQSAYLGVTDASA